MWRRGEKGESFAPHILPSVTQQGVYFLHYMQDGATRFERFMDLKKAEAARDMLNDRLEIRNG